MKILKNLTASPWLAPVLGVPAFGLMALLMRTGLDDRNLFIPGHFAGILLWILTAAMTAAAFLSVQQYGGKAKYGRMFPASTPAACGILAAAAAVAWIAWSFWASRTDILDQAAAILGLAAACSLVYLAWCRFRGLRSSFLLWGMVTGFMMLRLMLCYRVWSGEPELLRYCFPLFASVCLTLAFYYRTAFSVGMGDRRKYLFFTQLSVFFCLAVLGSGFDLFYLGMLGWCLLDLTTLRPMKTGAREELPEEDV